VPLAWVCGVGLLVMTARKPERHMIKLSPQILAAGVIHSGKVQIPFNFSFKGSQHIDSVEIIPQFN
jgi:hypothetical protein